MTYKCKKCGQIAVHVSLYDEEGVDGIYCENCDITEIEEMGDYFEEVNAPR